MIINCSNIQTKDKIKEKVQTEIENYTFKDELQKDPKTVIRGVEEEYIDGPGETILEGIKEQNDKLEGCSSY